jgi:hypothetical protein
MIAETIDRKVHVQRRYENCDPTDALNLVRLSTELRFLDTTVTRLLKAVETDLPKPMSQRSAKAQRAMMARWAGVRDATG